MESKKLALVLISFMFISILIWAPIHERLHGVNLNLFGFEVEYGKSWLFPNVHCIDCAGISQTQFFLAEIAPYILDYLVITLYFFYRNKLLKWLSYLGAADIVSNLIIYPNDFYNIIKQTPFDLIVYLIVFFGLFTWYISNKKDMAFFSSFKRKIPK